LLNYKKLTKLLSEEFLSSFGVNPKVQIQRASDDGDGEIVYMEKDSIVEWTKKDVSDYYKNLNEKQEKGEEVGEEKWNRFIRKKRKMTEEEDN